MIYLFLSLSVFVFWCMLKAAGREEKNLEQIKYSVNKKK